MLGGFLGGLANLGTAYKGYLGAQDQYLQNQLRQQQLQDLQNQQLLESGVPALARAGLFSPQAGATAQPFQPSPTAGVPSAPGAPTSLMPPAYQTTPSTAPAPAPAPVPLPLPSVPNTAPQLAGLGTSPGTPQDFGGTSAVGVQGLQGSPSGPSSPLGGTGFATGLNLRGDPLAQRGLPQGPLANLPTSLQTSDTRLGLSGPPSDFGSTFTGAATFTPTRPQQAAARGGPDLAGQQNLLPQYDRLGATRPLGPGEYVTNSDGSWSNEYSVTVGDPNKPGQYMVVPSLWLMNGKPTILSEDQAAQTAASSGLTFPRFGSEKAAEAFSTRRENIWQKTPVGRSDAQAPLWSQPGATPGMQPTGAAGTDDTGGMAYVGTGAGGPNNPGNIKTADGGWQRFSSPQEGTAAIGDWLVRAQTQHGATTVRQIIDRYAPPSDPGNAGKNLPEAAARIVGVGPDDPIDMRDPATRQKMVRAIAAQEGARPSNGVQIAYADMNRNLSPEQHGIGSRGAQLLLQIPQVPQAIQMMDPRQVMQVIDRAYPGTSDAVKGAIFLKVLPMMNAQAKEYTAQAWDQFRGQIQRIELAEKIEHDVGAENKEKFGPVEDFIGPDGKPVLARSYQTGTGGVGLIDAAGRPLDPNQYRKPLPGEATASKGGVGPYQVFTDPTNNQQFMMRPGDPSSAKDLQGNPYKPGGVERVGGASGRQWSEESIDAVVEQTIQSGDPGTAMARLPRSGPARQQFEEALTKRLAGMPGGLQGGTAQLLYNKVKNTEIASAARTAGRVTIQSDLYANEAAFAAQQVKELSKRVPRTEFKPINEILLAYETNTGDPNVIALGQALNNLRNVYGKLSNPTGVGVHDADKAAFEKILGPALSPEQLDAGVDQILIEGRNLVKAAIKTQQEALGGMLPVQPPGVAPQAAPEAPAPSGPPTSSGPDQPALPPSATRDKPVTSGPYKAGDTIIFGNRRYRVTGGDPNNPELEPVQ